MDLIAFEARAPGMAHERAHHRLATERADEGSNTQRHGREGRYKATQ